MWLNFSLVFTYINSRPPASYFVEYHFVPLIFLRVRKKEKVKGVRSKGGRKV